MTKHTKYTVYNTIMTKHTKYTVYNTTTYDAICGGLGESDAAEIILAYDGQRHAVVRLPEYDIHGPGGKCYALDYRRGQSKAWRRYHVTAGNTTISTMTWAASEEAAWAGLAAMVVAASCDTLAAMSDEQWAAYNIEPAEHDEAI